MLEERERERVGGSGAYYQEYRPSIWQRLAAWDHWPWHPKIVRYDDRIFGTEPYLVNVMENDRMIGWHPVDSTELRTEIHVSRWSALRGVISPLRYTFTVGRDPGYEAQPPTPGG